MDTSKILSAALHAAEALGEKVYSISLNIDDQRVVVVYWHLAADSHCSECNAEKKTKIKLEVIVLPPEYNPEVDTQIVINAINAKASYE